MPSIDKIICQSINPFDSESFVPGNFWEYSLDTALAVNSIHQEATHQIEEVLQQVINNHYSKTLLLLGDAGSGKSYLLGRLKQTFNSKAFFAYIGPWSDSSNIWRHTLRQTVDSLVRKPEGQNESQLLLWLKGLSAFKKGGITKWLLGERGQFVKDLMDTYPAGIYNPKSFFGVLYDLTNPDLYYLACSWLKGDILHEDELKALKVSTSIDTEAAAKSILASLGRIATNTQPIVLCYDSLDNTRLPDNSINFQPLFNINTTIHNESLKNFLVIISVITSTWNLYSQQIQPADLAQGRIFEKIRLKPINQEQMKALWAMRLHPLHAAANPQPRSNIYPLNQEQININFPGGKTKPRTALTVARELYQTYKQGLCIGVDSTPPPSDNLPAFELKWQDEFRKVTERLQKITLLSAPELIKMLQEALAALEVKNIKPKLLSGRYNIYSFSYQQSGERENTGIVWTEDGNMRSFFHIMNACQKVIEQNACQTMYLIRHASVGTPDLAGNKIYRQLFHNSSHHHLKPDIASVRYLAAYYELVKAACAKELVLNGKEITLEELQKLTRRSEVLNNCSLLYNLKVTDQHLLGVETQEARNFLLNLIKTQQIVARNIILEKTANHFSFVQEIVADQLLQELCQENQVSILDPQAKPEEQLVCLVPQG